MTPEKIHRLKRKLQESRFRLCVRDIDFAYPLRFMTYVAVDDVRRMSSNGRFIFIDPEWLQSAPMKSLDFMLAHQLMHVILEHIDRPRLFAGDRFHLACDIIVNSCLREYGFTEETLPRVGRIFHQTFFPAVEGSYLTPEEAFKQTPFDPDALKDKKTVSYVVDSEAYWDKKDASGDCGIVLLSPRDIDPEDLRIEEEPEPEKIRVKYAKNMMPPIRLTDESDDQESSDTDPPLPPAPSQDTLELELKPVLDSIRYTKSRAEQSAIENTVNRIWQRPNNPKLDWRMLLNAFVQEEVCDYSFSPPDRRLQDCDFFLPDFNETGIAPLEILFAVDTSGSIEDEILSAVYGELCGAIEQFNGNLCGTLAFFDTRVYPPVPFVSQGDLLKIVPQGGGGTDLSCVFRFVETHDLRPNSIVVFTDGQGAFPPESAAMNIPVLWLLSRSDVHVPWGKCAWLNP